MNSNNLNLNQEITDELTKMLLLQGLSQEDINEILNGQYQQITSTEQLPSIIDNDKFSSILTALDEGYTLDEMETIGIQPTIISEFKSVLQQNSLSVESVKAFNKYSSGSNMILAAKRGIPRVTILNNIFNEFNSRLTDYGFPQDQIIQIETYIKGLDYSKPLHENYSLTRIYLEQFNISSKFVVAIQSTVRHLDSFHHLDETLSNLDKGLKTQLQDSMELYRAVESGFLRKKLQDGEDFTSLIGKRIEEKGYSSTSPIYDTSFAKYDNYDVVFVIYAPKGTQGISITPFSSYGTAEQEVLLNSNDLFIVDVIPDVVDKNGKTKIICKALMLSKDKSCYKGIKKQQNSQQYANLEEDVDYKQFADYRQKINSILDSLPKEVYAYSSFFVYKTQEQQYRCRHTLEIVVEGQKKQLLLEQDFQYTEHFKKGLLEPSIVDFLKRTPISSTKLAPTPNQTPKQIAQGTKSDVHLFGETNNMLSVNNVDTAFAVQISHQAFQINPDIFMQRQAQLQQKQMV